MTKKSQRHQTSKILTASGKWFRKDPPEVEVYSCNDGNWRLSIDGVVKCVGDGELNVRYNYRMAYGKCELCHGKISYARCEDCNETTKYRGKALTVADMIAKLQKLPGNALVYMQEKGKLKPASSIVQHDVYRLATSSEQFKRSSKEISTGKAPKVELLGVILK